MHAKKSKRLVVNTTRTYSSVRTRLFSRFANELKLGKRDVESDRAVGVDLDLVTASHRLQGRSRGFCNLSAVVGVDGRYGHRCAFS